MGALVGRGLRPLDVGQVHCEDEAGDGDDGGEDEVVWGVGLGCGKVRGVGRHG